MRLICKLTLVMLVLVCMTTLASAAPVFRVFGGAGSNYCVTGDPDLFGGGALGASNGSLLVEVGGYVNACRENPPLLFASLAIFPIQEGRWRIGLGGSLDYEPNAGVASMRPEGIVLFTLSESGTKRGPDRSKHYAERGIFLDARVGVRNAALYATLGFLFYFN